MKYLKFASVLSIISVATCLAQAEGKGVLMVGDSLSVGNLSKHVLKLLNEEIGGRVRIIASGGSKPVDWTQGEPTYENTWGYSDNSNTGKTELGRPAIYLKPYQSPKLATLMQSEKPDIVVIQQGTNLMWDLTEKSDLSLQKAQIKKLYDQVFAIHPLPKKCLWVAPPDTSIISSAVEDRIFYLISDVVSKRCKVLDSRDIKRIGVYPCKPDAFACDGVHHPKAYGGPAIQKRWARVIVDEIKKLKAEISK